MKLALPVLLAVAALLVIVLRGPGDVGSVAPAGRPDVGAAPPRTEAAGPALPDPVDPDQGVAAQERRHERAPAAPTADVPGPRPLEVVVMGYVSGTPIEGARVREQSGRSRFDAGTMARTDRHGRATVHVSPFAQLLIEAEGHGRGSVRFDEQVPQRAQVTLLEHASLGGTVRGAGGGVTVHVRAGVTGAEHVDRRVPLAEDGRWRVADLAIPPQGALLAGIEVDLVDGARTLGLARGLSLQPGEHRELASDLAGLLNLDLRLVYPDGEAVRAPQRVLVRSVERGAGRAEAECASDDGGRAQVEGLPPGRYRVLVGAPQGAILHRESFDLLRGGDSHDVVVHGFGPLTGHVSLPPGLAVGAVVVRAIRIDDGDGTYEPDLRSVPCGPDGSFRFDLLCLGARYAVEPVPEKPGPAPFALVGAAPRAAPGGPPVELRLAHGVR